MGNVLSLDVDVVPLIAAQLGMTARRFADFARDGFDKLLIGAVSAEEFWQSFNHHFGTDMSEDLLITRFHPVVDERVRLLILELKAAGHRVVCGTNSFEKHYLYHLERGEYAVFDRVYASHLMRIAKPSPAFFRSILEQEGWQAYGTLFVDDRASNVAAARDLGIHSFLYETPESYPALQAWLAGEKALPGRHGS